jgi:hypothetical protein
VLLHANKVGLEQSLQLAMRKIAYPDEFLFRVYPCSVVHRGAIDLELLILRHIRDPRFEGGVEEDSTVAITHTSTPRYLRNTQHM